VIHLDYLPPAAEEGWWTLFDLSEIRTDTWMLIGGQMMQVLAAEHGVYEKVRATVDVDVVVNVRTQPGGTQWLAGWLGDRGFSLAGINADGIGHRFTREATHGDGTVIFDVLAPEGLGEKTNTYTAAPARTVQVPGSVQAFARSDVVEVTVTGMTGRNGRSGLVRRPSVLGALVAKAAATTIASRENPERDWQDAALLLATLTNPAEAADACGKKDFQRLRLLAPLADRDHQGWANLGGEDIRRGTSALSFLTNT
jgi:hypothetical protein